MPELIGSSSVKGKYHLRAAWTKPLRWLAMLFFALAAIAGAPDRSRAEQPPTIDPALYGPYPSNYKEIVTNWLQTQLIDPSSARIEWKGDPKPADMGKKDEHLYGFLVTFTVNARNRFGAYTGKQEHGALIKNGEVIKGVGFGY